MEEKCFNCERSDDEVRLFDAIYGREMVKTCKECSSKGDIILIKKPNSLQLKDSEKPPTVYERLSKMAGLPTKIEKSEKEKQAEKKLIEIEESKEEKPFQLINNFHWHIQRARRKKGLSQKQLADSIAESEAVIKMIENADVPENAEKVIKKIEQFLGISIRKGREKREKEEKSIPEKEPARVIKFDEDSIKGLTIADLRIMKEQREQAKMVEEIMREEKEREKEWKGLTKEEREKLREEKEETD